MKRICLKHQIGSLVALCLYWGLTLPVGATDPAQPLTTLELVRTYPSEDAFRAAHPMLEVQQHPIQIEEDVIRFLDPDTGTPISTMQKQEHRIVYTDAEKALLADESTDEPVIKSGRSYYIPPKSPKFLIEIEYDVIRDNLSGLDGAEGEPEYQEKRIVLYNHRSEKVTDLPLDVNIIVASPDNRYFVGYYDGPDKVGQYLYFYTADGKLLKKQERTHSYSDIRYSAHGKRVAFYSLVGKYFYIYTKEGDLQFSANYQDYVGKKSVFYGVFVTDNGYMLLYTSGLAFLLDPEGTKLWELPSDWALSCHFNLKADRILVATMVPNLLYEQARQIGIISFSQGQLLDEIHNVTYYTIMNGNLYIKIGETYYEYAIK